MLFLVHGLGWSDFLRIVSREGDIQATTVDDPALKICVLVPNSLGS